jgi:ATP-dependent Clp protease ATP-binding subunit ClpC
MRTLARALVRHRTNSAILVGEPGVGKTGVVEGLATLAASADAPAGLAGLRFVELPVATLVAGTKYRGELEERVDALIREAAAAPDVVLFIDEIHLITRSGGRHGSAGQVGELLKAALARGEIRCIGATTVDEFHLHVEADRALQRRFELIWVDEPTRAEALEILTALRPRFAEHFGVTITDDALAAAVDLSHRYLPDLRLPDKAIELVDQACAAARIVTLSPDAGGRVLDRVDRAEIAAVVAARARVPVERLTRDEARRLLGMEDALGARVVGQRRAVRAVSDAVRTARAGLADPRRPAGVFLFAGPTGTGKTELAKALAEFLFGDEDALVRIDMSEYKERHAVSRLIGAPPGYLGHDRDGQLTGPVRTDPYRVVLFDEIEKAHPEVLDLLLQLLDDGRLTDARGRRASFTECIVVLTTNLGASEAQRTPLGFGAGPEPDGRAPREQRIMDAVRGVLRPELVGRIGDPVVFDPLTADDLSQILDRLFAAVRERLAERHVRLRVDATAADLLVRVGLDPSRGARELERAVERLVTTPVAAALLDGRLAEGGEVVALGCRGEVVLRFGDPGQATARDGR